MIPGVPDILRAFCIAFGIGMPLGAKTGSFLFPRAILAPGWRHMCDNLLQRGLNSCRFWPHFFGGAQGSTELSQRSHAGHCH